MLSLLSLIIASGQVLRTDTDPWTPERYPDPRTNATGCNIPEYSTLCDPDHLLTDDWRSTIRKTLAKHKNYTLEAEVPYVEEAKELCLSNSSESAEIYVILAKRIKTSSEQSTTSDEIIKFGDGLRETYGLESQTCKNYVLIVGVELAKEIYVWTGSDLALTKHQVDTALSKFKNVFTERPNYQDGINKIVDEIGELILNPNRDTTTTEASVEETSVSETETTPPSTTPVIPERVIPVWIYLIIAVLVLAVIIISSAALWYIRHGMSHNIHPLSDSKTNGFCDPESGSQYSNNIQQRSITIITNDTNGKDENSTTSNNNSPAGVNMEDERSVDGSLSTRRNSVPITQAALNIINRAADTVLLRSSGYFSSTESAASADEEKKPDSKVRVAPIQETVQVAISPTELSTDVVLARRHSETMPHPARITDQFSSF